MARAITAGELVSLRTQGQSTKLRLAYVPISYVFKARVNGAPSSLNSVVQVTYDTVTLGAFGDIKPGQTVFIGTTEGGYEKGFVRVRKAPTSTILYIGETSDISWADNDYITVVNDFSPWQRHVYIDPDSKEVFMDRDIAYTDQHEDFDPMPMMGGHRVAKLVAADVDLEFDGSGSWVLDDTIASYLWTATGASTTAGMTTATPTISYNAVGFYIVSLTVTSVGGKSFTGYRYVWVYSDSNPGYTIDVLQLNSSGGMSDTGGWTMDVTAWADVEIADIRPMSGVVVFAEDIYDTAVSIGPWEGEENIVTFGWIDNETIVWDANNGTVTFTAGGPSYWLNKMSGYPVGVEDTDLPEGGVDPTWTAISNLRLAKGLFHLFHWRSTITMLMDLTLDGDTRQLAAMEAPPGTLWEQIITFADATVLAFPKSDRTGRMFVQIDSQFLETADRSSIPVVQTFQAQDLRETVEFMYEPARKVGMLDVTGTVYSNGDAEPICVKAPGNAISREGVLQRRDRLAFESAEQAVTLAGYLLGWMNNKYPLINTRLSSNHRMFDIAPLQYGTITVATSNTPRAISFTKNIIPRAVRFTYNEEAGVLLTDVEFEAETFNENAVQVECPEFPLLELELILPGIPPWPIGPPLGGGDEYVTVPAACTPVGLSSFFTESSLTARYLSNSSTSFPFFENGGVDVNNPGGTGARITVPESGTYKFILSISMWLDACTPTPNNFYNNINTPIYANFTVEKYNSDDLLIGSYEYDSSDSPAYTYTLDTGSNLRTNDVSHTGISIEKTLFMNAGDYVKVLVEPSSPLYGEMKVFLGTMGLYKIFGAPFDAVGAIMNIEHFYKQPDITTVIESTPMMVGLTNNAGTIEFDTTGVYIIKYEGTMTGFVDSQMSLNRNTAPQDLCNTPTHTANRKYGIYPGYTAVRSGFGSWQQFEKIGPGAGSSFHSYDPGVLESAYASRYLVKVTNTGDYTFQVGGLTFYHQSQNSKITLGPGFAVDFLHSGVVSVIKVGNV